MGAQTGEPHRRRFGDGVSKPECLVGCRANTAHPGVDLQVNGGRQLPPAGDRLQLRVRVDREVETARTTSTSVGGCSLSTRIGTRRARFAQRHALLHKSNTQAARTALQRRLGNLLGAVPVAVGFDVRPTARPAQRPRRAARRCAGWRRGRRRPTPNGSQQFFQHRRNRDRGDRWPPGRGETAAAGLPVNPRPCGGRMERLHPTGEQGADDAAEHIAGSRRRQAASPAVTTSASPSGSATTVAAPFSSTVQPLSAASRRAATMRSSPGGPPFRTVYSPSCGVRTVGDMRRRNRARHPRSSTRARTDRRRRSPWAAGLGDHLRTLAPVSSERPRPGPTTIEWNRSNDAKAARPSLCSATALHDLDRGVAERHPGNDRCTMPAPDRIAACDTGAARRSSWHCRRSRAPRSATCGSTRRAPATTRQRPQPAPSWPSPQPMSRPMSASSSRRPERCRAA